MTAISWKSAVSDNWTVAADWSTGTVPGAGDDVTIGVAGSYTVALTTATTVGSITLSDPSATLAIAAPGHTEAVAGRLSNSGALDLDTTGGGGTSLTIGLPLTNQGSFFIGNASLTTATTVSAYAVTNSGFIDLIGSSAAPTFQVTWGFINTGTVYVDLSGSGGSSVTIGRRLTNSSSFYIGNTSLAKATTVTAAALSNYGSLTLYSGSAAATLNVTGAFINTATVQVDPSGGGGSQVTIGGTLSNSGSLSIGSTSLAKATTVTAAALVSTGAIYMNEGTVATATLHITGAAPTTLSGTYQLSGDALLEFGSGGVTAIGSGASVTLNGPNARVALSGAPTTNSALTKLANNAGVLILENAAVALTTTVALDNNYYLEVDQTGTGGSKLTIGGTLTNENYVYIGNTSLTAATTVSATAVSNYGTVYLYSGTATATLKTTGAFRNANNASVNVDTSGVGGSRLTIGGMLSNNGTLDIGNTSLAVATTVRAAGFANTGTVNLSGGATAKATLASTAAGSNSGTMNIGGFGVVNTGSKTYTQMLGATNLAANGGLTAATIAVTGGVLQGTGTVTGKIVNTGGSVAGGIYTSNSPGTLTVTRTYSQSATGILQEVLTGTGAGQQSELAVSGASNIQGGTLKADVFFALAAGEVFTVMTFAHGTLPGLFDTIADGAFAGDGAYVAIGGGLTLGALYNVAAGNIELQVLTTPATTADSWNGGSGNWSTAADWSAGTPTSDTDVTIGQTGSGTVTLDTGDTIDSLTITSGNTLSFAVNKALVVGGNVTVRSGGTLTLAGGDGLEVGGNFSDAGHMTVGKGDTVELFSTPLNVTGTLTVAGKIETAGTTAVTFGSSTDRLILDPGFSFVGLVQGGGANSTLELAAGAGTGVLNALGTEFTNFGKVTVDSGATWTVDALASALSGVTITGSGGSNTLALTSSGIVDLSGVSGFPTIKLASTAANTLTLASANFTGVTGGSITVDDGNSGNIVTGSTLPATDAIIVHAGAGADTLTGGAGNDIFYAATNTTMTGGAGTNQFTFADIGTNGITDFGAEHASNELVLRNSGFNLGADQGLGTGTPQHLLASVFSTKTDGTFDNTSERFAYNTTTGVLFYSANGSGSAGSAVVTLTGHPGLSAGGSGNLYFTS